LTYTQSNQDEVRRRIAQYAGDHPGVVVMGWFTFLLRHFAKPFLPFKFPGLRVRGFNFEGQPHRMAKGERRFLDSNGAVYACELGRLASELVGESGGALIRRLECIFDEVLIDEVQDLSAHDWEIADYLLESNLDVQMVGDIRQAVLATNPRSGKNKKYAYAEAMHWFREREAEGRLSIEENNVTWRCHARIAAFADTIFHPAWGFPATESCNYRHTSHDGVYLLREAHLDAYLARYQPMCMRDSANSGKKWDLPYTNFRVAKGQSCKRALIVPTAGIQKFIQSNQFLDPIPAAKFYVAVTRAEQSVAILLNEPGESSLPTWRPPDDHAQQAAATDNQAAARPVCG
jgi:hypothetical protein